jgi:xanthine dehydrogenase YagR molybdenum-binding subunit
MIQGIGTALLEQTQAPRHLHQRQLRGIPVLNNADIRSIDIIMIPEEDREVNPIGVKGIGEIGIVGVAAAVANAVYHATGKRVRDLPITIEKLM